jgi:hypothetical protein
MSLFPTARVPIPTQRQFFTTASVFEPQSQLTVAPGLSQELQPQLAVGVAPTLEESTEFDFELFSSFEPRPQLDIFLVPQVEDAWCYAACAEMVINFCHGPGTVSKCQVAKFIKNADCCTSNDAVCTASGCQKDDIQSIFQEFGVAFEGPNELPIGTVSLAELTNEIEVAQRPVEVVVDWVFSQGSHALILCGTLGDFVYILDPLFTDTGWRSYDYLLDHDGEWDWDRTWLGLRKKE